MTEAAEIPTDVERQLARERAGQPGVWQFRRHEWPGPPPVVREYINVAICPCGCGRELSLPLVRKDKVSGDCTWLWNGDEVNPTLQPSIRRLQGCRWHGFLTAGRWSHCADGAPCAPDCYVSPTAPPAPPPHVPVVPAPRGAPSPNPAHRYAPPLGQRVQPPPARAPHGVMSRSEHASRARRINQRLHRR